MVRRLRYGRNHVHDARCRARCTRRGPREPVCIGFLHRACAVPLRPPLPLSLPTWRRGGRSSTPRLPGLSTSVAALTRGPPPHLLSTAFVHNSEINSEGFRYLKEGERVEFELEESAKGLVAKNVSAVGGAPLDQTPRSADPDA